ncbi:MAG: enoyl-CoA hydratase family protein [Chloroflexi bacterium]|nr:enoyl-CoA hydratase family protein [Chloroflexota bacterium]MDA8189205.1 enoyl-CoA hydratase family protein [Dehalococcoidales bacterium]
MAYDAFLYEVKDGIATITFNRPDRLNAITFAVYAQLRDLLAELRGDDSVKVLVITGQGRGFCSGGDVEDIIGKLFDRDMRGVLEFTRMTGAVVNNLRRLDKPVIASINGIAAGAGAVIAAASDFRILSERAKFAFLFTKVGLAGGDMGIAYLLPRIVGLGRAIEILMLGDTIDAQTSERIGLANKVVPEAELQAATMELAQRLANGPALAYSMTKQMLNNELSMDLEAAIENEALGQALLLMGKDHREFYNSFVEKRPPNWTGR